MKKLGISTLLALTLSATALTFSTTAGAVSSNKFTSTFTTISAPIKVNVTLSEDMVYRADHLSKNLRDRSSGLHSANDGWTGAGNYGQKDLDRLTERLKRRMEIQLTKQGFTVSEEATNTLSLVLVDARPNRPTFKQMSQANLSMRSFAIGGAKFEGTLTQDGQDQGMVSYGWYETDITDAQYGSTWSDANRAIDRFARKVAKSVK
ncbi:MAG: hypothetical protein COA69_00580 [Robiginitomaculum sp.]|nr:MAG: hypothetical protein COA69_00580 [Robiginitomaculum sp.]